MNITIEEQEIIINAARTDDMAEIYCSDSTWITKMDKLVKKSPILFKVINQDDVSKTYEFPKRLISIRSSIKEMSEEQRTAAGERMKQYHDIRKNKKVVE